MKSYIMLLAFLVILTAFSLYAEIVSGYVYVPVSSDLSFTSNAVTPTTCLRNEYNGGVYPCSTSARTIDLFVAVEYGLYVCAYTCWNIAIGSPRPFYVSRQAFDPLDLLSPLDLKDTARFSRIDTIHRDMHIPMMPFGDSLHCYQPHIGTVNANYSPIEGGFLLLKTSTDKFAIAIPSPVFLEQKIDTYYRRYLGGFQVTWHMQTDGTLNFSDITSIRMLIPHGKTILQPSQEIKELSQGIYNIKGQRISANYLRLQKAPGIIIIMSKWGLNRMCTLSR
jgi:hypothetical protein